MLSSGYDTAITLTNKITCYLHKIKTVEILAQVGRQYLGTTLTKELCVIGYISEGQMWS